MQKMNYIMMKTLKLKALSIFTFNIMTLFHELKKKEIFNAFNINRRMKI